MDRSQQHPLVGFHTTEGGHNQGIGDHFRALRDAGIRLAFTSEGNYGVCLEALNNSVEGSLICWRKKGDRWGIDIDVPHMSNGKPVETPDSYFERVMSAMPPEWDNRTWLAVMNEVGRVSADGYARYALELAPRFKAQGIKTLWFAWSAGTPEREHWESPDMLAFLRMCESEPEWYGVAIHEYSYTVDSLIDSVPHGYPHQTGRWRLLRDVCQQHGIDFSKITLLIKEFGWERGDGHHQAVPPPDEATAQLDAFMRLDKSPHLFRTIWYLGEGEFGQIGRQTQRLIAPVTDWILNNKYDVESAETVPPTEDGVPMTHPPSKPKNIGRIDPDFGLYQFLKAHADANDTEFDEISEEWSGDGVTPNEWNYQDAIYKNGQYGWARVLKPEFNLGSWGTVEWHKEPDPKV